MAMIKSSYKMLRLAYTSALFLPTTVFAYTQNASPPSVSQQLSASTESKPPAADNSRANANQNGEQGLSAEQQSNSKSDIELTRKIRQALVKDKKLSVYAHNVKIITDGGQVVLKGPVKTQSEKDVVENKAGRIAGAERVRSELEIAPQ